MLRNSDLGIGSYYFHANSTANRIFKSLVLDTGFEESELEVIWKPIWEKVRFLYGVEPGKFDAYASPDDSENPSTPTP